MFHVEQSFSLRREMQFPKGWIKGKRSYYKKGYKYRSVKNDSIQLPIQAGRGYPSRANWNDKRGVWYCGRCIEIMPEGLMTVLDSYSWDGCSGPSINRKSNHRAGKFHDAGYECIRNGLLDEETWRPIFDQVFMKLCIEDGMWEWLAEKEYQVLRAFGREAATKPRKVYEAP
jgi:hypothetical protein